MATDTRPAIEARTLTVKQLCDLLQVSRSTLNKLRTEDGFPRPVIAIHQCLRWSVAEIDEWLSRQRR